MYFPFNLHSQTLHTVDGKYLYYVPEHIPLEIARQTAIERARLEAMAAKFGTTVSQVNTTSVTTGGSKSETMFLSSGGSEVRGEWIEDTREPDIEVMYENGMLCVKAVVVGKAREIAGVSVDIDARILRNGTDARFESSEFRSGDDLFLYFRTPVDGYLAVYLVDAEQQAFCLLPYRQETSGKTAVAGNAEYTFFSPDTVDENKQVVDEYTMTCDRGIEQNEMYIIFSPNEFSKANDRQEIANLPRQLPFSDFQKWLTKNRLKDKDMTVMRKPVVVKE